MGGATLPAGRCNMGEAVSGDRDRVKNVMAERLGDPERAAAQPVVMEGHDAQRASDEPEGMDIGFVGLAPAVECDAELVRPTGRSEEFGLVDSRATG